MRPVSRTLRTVLPTCFQSEFAAAAVSYGLLFSYTYTCHGYLYPQLLQQPTVFRYDDRVRDGAPVDTGQSIIRGYD